MSVATHYDIEEFLGIERIPRRPWEEVAKDIKRMWQPKDAPHHSVISINGGGKTYLLTRGILPLRENNRVLILDVKGDDPVLQGYGKPIREYKQAHRPWWKVSMARKPEPREEWYRLVITEGREKARVQVGQAVRQAYREGNITIVTDETRQLTDPRPPALNLRAELEQIWLRGRSRGVELVSMTQGPRWVPGSFYDQPSFVWIGRVNDELAQRRLREIGGLKRQHLPVIQRLKKRQFLVIGDSGDYTAITKVPPEGS